MPEKTVHNIFPICSVLVGSEQWELILTECERWTDPEVLHEHLSRVNQPGVPEYIPDLARLELVFNTLPYRTEKKTKEVRFLTVNSSVRLISCSWKNLALLIQKGKVAAEPEQCSELILIWKDRRSGMKRIEAASSDDLLALKVIVENLDRDAVAREGKITVGAVDGIIERAVAKDLLTKPPSRIRRTFAVVPETFLSQDHFLSTDVFTVQWHITQSCDLHCRHCYDRTAREDLRYEQADKILDDLRSFSHERNVTGAVSFSGGNPFLHPDFMDIYRAAAEKGFSTAILGNPVPRQLLEEVIDIRRPAFFQVSLEGLPSYNDYIRGPGHFDRMTAFLNVLRDCGVHSSVMLTLTEENMNQILPLAEMLRSRADNFFFNRLSMVGEGANLRLPKPDAYKIFIYDYLKAAQDNPILGLKDNLLNIARLEKGEDLFGGCTGYGCGAAFNFVAILPDGEVHACRKFPSYIGNIYRQTLRGIYDSGEAQRYRSGCSVCSSCQIRPVCGGCLAVSSSCGINPFEHKDPFCFISSVHEK